MTQLLQAAKASRAAIGTAIAAGIHVPLGTRALPIAIKHARLETIERLRVENNISREAICGRADISLRWYESLMREPARAGRATVTKLAHALNSCLLKKVDDAVAALVLHAAFGGFLYAAAEELGLEIDFVREVRPKGNRGVRATTQERLAHKARKIAIYLTNQYAGAEQHMIARLVGVSNAAICYAVREIEDERDGNTDLDEIISRCARKVTGREE